MANYDNDVLGVGNSQHPANRPELEKREPNTIEEALLIYSEDAELICYSRF